MADLETAVGEHAVAGLAEVLTALGSELRRAHESGESTIVLDRTEVELNVAVTAKAGGGVNFWVLKADGGGDYKRASKITVSMRPGTPWDNPEPSGQSLPDWPGGRLRRKVSAVRMAWHGNPKQSDGYGVGA